MIHSAGPAASSLDALAPSWLRNEVLQSGWQAADLAELDAGVHFHTFQGRHLATCSTFRNAADDRLLLVDLASIQLPDEKDLFPHFVDLAMEERMVLALAHTVGSVEWVLMRTHGRIDLLRTAGEAAEYRVSTREEFEGILMPALTAMARGRQYRAPGGGHQLPEAESLGGWIRHWSLQLAPALELPPDEATRLVWRWLLMLQSKRRTEGCEAIGGGWGLRCSFDEGHWTVSYDAVSAIDDLRHELARFDEFFSTRLLELSAADLDRRIDLLADTSLLDRLRAEMLMHRQNRFEPETVAWLFTDLAREQEGWRREVRGVEPIRRRMHLDGWTVYAPLMFDVRRYGLTAALSDIDRLADHLHELNLYERQRRAAQGGARQPDLFHPNPRGIDAEGLLADGINFMFGEALRLRGVATDERFGIGITLLLKALAIAARLGWPATPIQTLDAVFSRER